MPFDRAEELAVGGLAVGLDYDRIRCYQIRVSNQDCRNHPLIFVAKKVTVKDSLSGPRDTIIDFS
jgi:hypothetical protein